MNFVSLFSGIGGFDLGLERVGMTCAAQVEIDKNCQVVLQRHWPDVPRWSDVRDFGRHSVEGEIDLVCGGFPCQNLSTAGKRTGLKGSESGLWFEFYRVISEFMPRWVLIENVPGLLSSDKGRDLRIILDSLEELGYIVDIDIKDSKHFGVPQRRRRVFIVCEHVESLLQRKTTSSALTISQCLTEILLSLLVEQRSRSIIGYTVSDSESKHSRDGRLRRMKLFGLEERGHWPKLLDNLDAERERFPKEHELLGLVPGTSTVDTNSQAQDTRYLNTSSATGSQFVEKNTVRSWKNILEDLCAEMNQSTTSTEINSITESRIYTYAMDVLNIAAFISLSNPSSPSFWSAASSALTAIKEFTNYARQASSNLFTPMEWLHAWSDFIRRADRISQSFLDLTTIGGSSSEILPESEGMRGNPSSRGQAEQEVAGPLGSCTGGTRQDLDGGGASIVDKPEAFDWSVAGSDRTYITRKSDYAQLRAGGVDAVHIPQHAKALRASGSNGIDREDMHTLIPMVFETRVARNGRGMPEEIAPPLKSQSGKSGSGDSASVLYYSHDYAHERIYGDDGVANALAAGHTRHQQSHLIGNGIRRLLPVECLRLQGFPDDWCEGQSDTQIYRQTGNAVTVNVITWIGKRLLEADRET